MSRKIVVITVRVCLVMAVAVLMTRGEVGAAQEKSQAFSTAEKFVLEEIGRGEIADLEVKFKDDESNRIIRASFLEDLLINPDNFKIHRNGVAIRGARVSGFLNLANINIKTLVYLNRCQFDQVFFFQTVFSKGLTIDGSTFTGPVNLSYATVMEGLSADKARFLKEDEPANFDHLKVKGPASFAEAVFAGAATFTYAIIDGPFYVNKAQFLCKETSDSQCDSSEVSFNTMSISNGFFAQSASFERRVNLINLKLGDNFEGNKIKFNKAADFQMINVGHNVFLPDAEFLGALTFRNANINENLNLNRARLLGDSAQFQDATAGTVELNQTEFKAAPNLSSFTYQNIYPMASVLNLIKNSGSDYSAYNQLEKCLQKHGYSSQADDVFIEMKVYERRKGMNWFDSLRSYLSQALQGFGRRPHRVLYYDFAFLLIGAFLFRRRKMKLKSETANEGEAKATLAENSPPYNSFLYSLTLFAPTIDTQYTNNWEPKPEHRKTKGYSQAHKVLGYILVPLTIAIWTGIFQ